MTSSAGDMARNNVPDGTVERAIDALSKHGPWPLVAAIVLVALVVRADKIIAAVNSFMKTQKEVNQRLRQKQVEFERKVSNAIDRNTPTQKGGPR